MSAPETDRLVAELSRGLLPVRPLPKLRAVMTAIAVVWLGVAVADALLESTGWGGPSAALGMVPFAVALVGLALAASGALLAGLAEAIPGREPIRSRAEHILAVGIALCGLGTLAAFLAAPGLDSPGERCLECLTRSGGLALLPAIVAALYIGRGVTRRPLRSGFFAAAGCGALGAIAVHLTCFVDAGKHLLVGHMLAPLVVAVVLGAPMIVVAQRRRRVATRL